MKSGIYLDMLAGPVGIDPVDLVTAACVASTLYAFWRFLRL